MNPTDPDVRGRKGTTYYFIEIKGDPPTTQKIYQAIGEICTKRASTTPKTCCIAFPKSFASKLSKILPLRAWKKLDVKILIVSHTGEVTEYAPTEANLEEIKRL
jgi:hypothetical protein